VSPPPDSNPPTDSTERFELPVFQPGEVIAEAYVVTKKLGEGLLGAVYQVTTLKEKRELALKILRPNLVAEEIDENRFTRELAQAKRLRHPGIVEYHDVGEHDGIKYFTMELVKGASLRQKMAEYAQSGRDFTPQEMYGFLIQILEILKYAHRVTLHRNLKPENVLMMQEKGPDGRVRMRIKVTDFAIAHVISPTIFASSFVSREEAHYLAPELSRFQDKAGPESDIYSVGAIFYEMLTGKPPQGRYLLPSEVNGQLSKKLDDLVEIALAPNPADRFQSADDMINSVKLTFADLYGGSHGTVYRILAVLAVLALAGAAVGTYFYLDEGPTEEELLQLQEDHKALVRGQVKAMNADMDDPASPDAIQAKAVEHPDMVYIPKGYYLKGRWRFDELSGASEVEEITRFVASYWIDRYEQPNEKGRDPSNLATWAEAINICRAEGKQLCTEDQWEKACKGPEMWVYAYGDTFDPNACPSSGYLGANAYTTGSYPDCKTGYDVYDMGGGCWEWTFTKKAERKITKGGTAPGQEENGTRCSARKDEKPTFAHQNLAFRCCLEDE
jgi:formylglycine-generating enzyme required for sulfatase activity